MSRTHRVMDLLELLRASDARTVEDIAESLGVSRRTVLRDLASLRSRGWPIRSESGPGGGIYLDRDRGMRAVHLSLDEVVSLWLAAQLSTHQDTLPWSRNARSALDKVFASVPETRRRQLRLILQRVVIGRPASPQVQAALGPPPKELLAAFERAFCDNLCLGFSYTDRNGNITQRRAEPHGLLLESPAWYLLCRDRDKGEPRSFRMDRIRRARVLTKLPFHPDFARLTAEYHTKQTRAPQKT